MYTTWWTFSFFPARFAPHDVFIIFWLVFFDKNDKNAIFAYIMTNQDQALNRLLSQVEEKAGRKIKTPKDFEFLVEQIYEHTHTSPKIWIYRRELFFCCRGW